MGDFTAQEIAAEPLPWLARASATRITPAWVTATTSPPSLPRT